MIYGWANTTAAAWTWNDGYNATTSTTSTSVDYYIHGNHGYLGTTFGEYVPKPLTPQEKLRRMLQQRMTPMVHVRRDWLPPAKNEQEVRARETLRLMIGPIAYQGYLKNKFVTVRAKSGLVYQIFPGHTTTKVWKAGNCIEQLCVVLEGNYPPTDAVIMRYLMILNDEQEFRKLANKSRVYNTPLREEVPDDRPLLQIYKEIKNGVAA